jgi:hypothetical protein
MGRLFVFGFLLIVEVTECAKLSTKPLGLSEIRRGTTAHDSAKTDERLARFEERRMLCSQPLTSVRQIDLKEDDPFVLGQREARVPITHQISAVGGGA